MPTAKKLPSGSWRCQVFSHYEITTLPDGSEKKKRIYKSFTSDDPTKRGKKEAELAASLYAATKNKPLQQRCLTFGAAMDEYISKRSDVLSPRTIADYKRIRKMHLQSLMSKKIDDITQADIQEEINIEAKKLSPKTVRNNHGLAVAVMHTYRPGFAINTALPKKIRPDIYVPSDEDIRKLMAFVKDTDMELPIMLAAFGPMRRGEICALDTKNINGNVVHVCCNMVKDANNENWIIRQPKSYAGDRYIDYPDFVADLWKNKTGPITHLKPHNLTNDFAKILKRAGLPHFRFHDLRHYSASIQHALGIPDSYIMQRGGWGNDGVLKAVYRHTMESKEKEMNRIANEHFQSLMQHEMQHKTKKSP